MGRKLFFKFLLGFLLILAVSLLVQRVFQINMEDLREWVLSFGLLTPIVYTLVLTAGLTIPFNPVSDYVTVNLAAFLFHPLVSIVATFFAHSFALSINYFVAKRFGWKLLEKLISTEEKKYLENLAIKIKPGQIFWLRWLLPLTAVGVDLVSYSAAIARIPFIKFYLSSIVPWSLLNILFFSSTSFVIDRQKLLFFLPGLIIVATPPLIYYLYRKNAHVRGRSILAWIARLLFYR